MSQKTELVLNSEVTPAVPAWVPMSIQTARESDGLVWWRPDGILSEYPDSDAALVRVG